MKNSGKELSERAEWRRLEVRDLDHTFMHEGDKDLVWRSNLRSMTEERDQLGFGG